MVKGNEQTISLIALYKYH